jgi:hypothetical protein
MTMVTTGPATPAKVESFCNMADILQKNRPQAGGTLVKG